MPRFLAVHAALLHKEWRDVRALTIACAALVPAGLLALDMGFLDWRGDVSGRYYVPVCVALYVAVIASDLMAGDIATSRSRAFAALPTRWSSLWLTKLAFLVLATLGFTAWTVTSCTLLYDWLAPADAVAAFEETLGRTSRFTVVTAVFAAATVVFWSTVLERGFAVVGAAAVTCVALAGTLPLLAWIDPELLPAKDTVEACIVALPLVFLAGSLYAFVGAPHHSSSVWRRLTLAWIIPLIILLPSGAVGAAVLNDRMQVEPGDPDVHLVLGTVSPDGRYVTVLAYKKHENATTRTWVLDLEDGGIAELGYRGLQPDWRTPFAEDGSYVAWSPGDERGSDLRRRFDVETGVALETRRADQLGHNYFTRGPDWVRAARDLKTGEQVIELVDEGLERRLPRHVQARFSPRVGFALHTDKAGVHLHDLVAGTTRVLREGGPHVHANFSPTGRYVNTWGRGEQIIYDTETGAVVRSSRDVVSFLGGNSPDEVVLSMRGAGDSLLIELDSGAEHTLAPDPNRRGYPPHLVRVLPDRRVVLVLPDGRIQARALDGSDERTVYAPRRND